MKTILGERERKQRGRFKSNSGNKYLLACHQKIIFHKWARTAREEKGKDKKKDKGQITQLYMAPSILPDARSIIKALNVCILHNTSVLDLK